MGGLAQVLVLLGVATFVVLGFQRLRLPTSVGYLLVGVLVGPHTAGPVIDLEHVSTFAEFGVVFLLFTVGLSFSLPEIHALRRSVLGLGAAQVVLTTAAFAFLAAALGVGWTSAFVVGAVAAQSSTSILLKQLADQGDEHSPHGRLGTAISVFQDITAVPFVVVIPLLNAGAEGGATLLVNTALAAVGKGLLALAGVFIVGRRVLSPLFHAVARQRSPELFTLTVLFVSLTSAWTTFSLGVSLAFGAFLAGMVLGETEFRHQVEATVRPIRDVLLGLFFVGIGMLVDPSELWAVWPQALLGAVVLLVVKTLIVAALVRYSTQDVLLAWRTGLVVAVGGEFGFALLSLALGAHVIDEHLAQTVLLSVLLSFVLAPLLIRNNLAIARWCARRAGVREHDDLPRPADLPGERSGHVILCGYGRVGQGIGNVLEQESVPFVAIDLDAARVREAYRGGEPVVYGDSGQRELLESLGIARAALLVLAHGENAASLATLRLVRSLWPQLPVMVRTRDEASVDAFYAAGASAVFPETLEAGLMMASQVLREMRVPLARILRLIEEQRTGHYAELRQVFVGHVPGEQQDASAGADRLRPVQLGPSSPALGRTLGELGLREVVVTALVRQGVRELDPLPERRLEADDTLVLFGAPAKLSAAERELVG